MDIYTAHYTTGTHLSFETVRGGFGELNEQGIYHRNKDTGEFEPIISFGSTVTSLELTQSEVSALLPHLECFARTGRLVEEQGGQP